MTFDEFAVKVFGESYPSDATLEEFSKSPDLRTAVTLWVLEKCTAAGVRLADELPSSVPFDELPATHAANVVEGLIERIQLKLTP